MFGLQGCNKSCKIKWGDVKLLTDDNGDDYLRFEERETKTRKGEENGSRALAPNMFPNKAQPEGCPVAVYRELDRRRPAAMKGESPCYMAASDVRKSTDQVWLMRALMGKKRLGELLKSGCASAGVPGKKTNHSVRKTGTKGALEAGCPRCMWNS